MRKNLKKQTAVLIVSAALAAQTSLAGYGAPLTPGDWKQEDGAWRFCDPEQNAYAGWVLTSSGWYYMDPSDGKMVTGWKQINGYRYYFETQQGKTEGKMHTGWYQDEQGKWYFFNNKSGEKTEGTMVTGWKWIDGKCYYFSENEDAGVLYVNTVTPDGFSVNDQGQWVDENGNVKTRSESDFTTIQKSTTTVTRSSGSGGGSSHSSSSSSGNSGSSDNSGNSSNSGKDDTGKDDTGKDDTGKDDSGKDDSGKDDTGKDDSGKDDTGKDDSGKDDTGNGGDSGKDDSGNTDKPDDKPEETKILTGEAEVASNEYGSVSGTYQVKVKVTVDKDGNIISVEDDGTEPGKRNSSFWEDALELFEEFGGEEGAKTIEEVDQVEAVSGATISSNAIKAAVKKALQSEDPTEKPDAPAIKTADQRTRFVFSAAEPADLLITAPEGTQIRYTTDGSDPAGNSQAFVAEGTGAETAVSVSAAENATGTMILKAVAVKDGQASDVTEKELSFIQIPEVQEKGIKVYEASGMITSKTNKPYVYYEQSADIEILSQYEEEGKKEVLSAVGAAIKKAISATPVFTVDPVKGTSSTRYGTYEYEEKPVATISCLAEGTEIYYYITDTSSTVKPDKDTWTKYEGPVSVLFDNEKGGSKYLWAATTTDDGETWLKTSKIQFVYSKKPVEDAVVIGDQAYTSFEKALAAAQDGDTLILNDDVELTDEVTMPEASISIQSGEKGPYLIKSTKPLNLNGDLTISDVSWNATTYANGYNFTAGENVTCSSTKDIYAGSASGTAQAKGEDNTCYITLSSGKFYVYGTGAAGSTMEGDVEVLAEKEAQLQFAGTKGKSELNGDFTVTVDATEGNAALSSSYGRTSSGTVSGEFTLTIKGAPKLSGTIYAVQYNSSASWGTLDVTEAELEELELDTLEKLNKKFQGFETVNSEFDEEDEKTEEEVAAELLSKVKEDEQENSQEKKETETVIPAEDPETEDKEEENSDEEDKSAEEEDPEETEDADSKEDEEEDAPEVLDADETTEDTSSEEAETISQDEE